MAPRILNLVQDQEIEPNSRNSYSEFYWRRYMRLAPALSVCVIASAILILFFSDPETHFRFLIQGVYSIFGAGNIAGYRYQGDYFDSNQNPMIHLWSLGVEEQFYLFVPIFFGIILRRNKSKRNSVIEINLFLTLLSLIACTPKIYSWLYASIGIYRTHDFAFYSPINRYWEFGIGFIFATAKFDKFRNKSQTIRNIFALTVVIGFMIYTKNLLEFFLLAVASLCFFETKMYFLLKTKIWFNWLGDRSFSIYLFHMPIIVIIQNYPSVQDSSQIVKFVGSLLGVLASIIIGSLVYARIESVHRIKGDDHFERKKIKKNLFKFTLLPVTVSVISLAISGVINNNPSEQSKLPVSKFMHMNCQKTISGKPNCAMLSKGRDVTVMLLGDSHALHFADAFRKQSESRNFNWIIWASSSCQFELRKKPSKLTDYCLESNVEALKKIEHYSPDLIILSQYLTKENNIENIMRGVEELSAKSKKLIVIENTPVFPDGASYLKLAPLFTINRETPEVFERSRMKQDPYKNIVRKLTAASQIEVSFITFDDLICTHMSCSRRLNGKWLYYDSNHFSKYGENLAGTKLSTLFDTLELARREN